MPFTISTLPGKTYHEMKNACSEFQLFQWHVIQIAIKSMCYLKQHHPEALATIVTEVREEFPRVARVPYESSEDDGPRLDRT